MYPVNYAKHLSPTNVISKYNYRATYRSGMLNALAKVDPMYGQKIVIPCNGEEHEQQNQTRI